ncbi:hypothetical protein [Crossiella sp. CA198]|uniref:hypothetical protein n=1 Tax=Crossiella sp. CA198 TaxID=3455607 RepID=UPI003F8CFA52
MERHRHPDTAVPAYGSPAWHALPQHHPHRDRATVLAAEAWHRYWSPEMRTLRAEQAEREIRARFRAVAFQLSAGMPERFIIGPTYRELEARRALHTTTGCGHPGCTNQVWVRHPFPPRWLDTDGFPAPATVRCPTHDIPGQAPDSGIPSPQDGALRPSTALSAPVPTATSRPGTRQAGEGTAA